MASTAHDRTAQWETYEAGVQSYRGLSLSTQSLFLAVGAILLDAGFKLPFFAMLALAMIATWYVFFPTIAARTRIVDFHKFRLDDTFDRQGRPFAQTGEEPDDHNRLLEREYAHTLSVSLRRRVAEHRGRTPGQRASQWGPTRRKLDIWLPVLTTATWVVFAVYVVAFR